MRVIVIASLSLIIAAVFLIGCGGGNAGTTPDSTPRAESGPFSGLPGIPSGSTDVRQANLVDTDTQLGTDSIDFDGATAVGTSLLMETATTPGGNLAYAMYQFPERPGEDLHSINVSSRYMDEQPNLEDPLEGYWVGIADYSSGGWDWSGPFQTINTRILAQDIQPVSPGGFIYAIVVVHNGSDLYCDRIESCYYTAEDYDQHWLPLPSGESAGMMNDIQVDPSGNIQIAYMHGAAVLGEMFRAKPRIATKTGNHWEYEEIELPFQTNLLRFGLGSGGLRGLLFQTDTDDLYLYWDDGTGTFTEILIEAGVKEDVVPSIEFINKDGTPDGPKNLALVVYGGDKPGSKMDIKYYGIDDTGTTRTGNLGEFEWAGRLNLETDSNGFAHMGMPILDGGIRKMVPRTYFAGANTWNLFMGSPLEAPDIATGDYEPYFFSLPLDGPTTTGVYVNSEKTTMVFSTYDQPTTTWNVLESDRQFVYLQDMVDLEKLGANQAALACMSGNMCPAVKIGEPGSGDPWELVLLDTESYCGMTMSIATEDDGTVHAASYNPVSGELNYYRLSPARTVTKEQADPGGNGWGLYFGYSPVIEAGGQLHYFMVDVCHFSLRHAVNKDGVWLTEDEVLPGPEGAYLILGSGYLEDTGELWCAVISYIDFSITITYGPPDGSNWRKCKFISQVFVFSMLEDNESEIGMLTLAQSPAAESALSFFHGHPSDGLAQREVSIAHQSQYGVFFKLGYNQFDNTWYAIGNDDSSDTGFLLKRVNTAWIGPYTIAQRQDSGDNMEIVDIICRPGDGQLQAVFCERDDSESERLVNLYTSDDFGLNWSAPVTISSWDNTIFDYRGLTVKPDDNGDAVVCVPLSDGSTFDVHVYNSDGAGTWSELLTWASPLRQLAMEGFPIGLDWLGDGQVAIAAIEGFESSSTFGRPLTYYPW